MWFQKPPLGTPLDWGNPLNDETVLALAMNEGHGDKIQDLSMNGNHGTLTNFAFPPTTSSGWNPGQTGVGLNFDGTNDYVRCSSNKNLTLENNFTISFLARRTIDHTRWARIIYKTTYRATINPATEKPYFSLDTAGGTDDVYLADSLPLHKTACIALTYSSPMMSTYIDGVTTTKTHAFGGDVVASADDLLIGIEGNDAFGGSIDQVRIQSRAWSAKEARDYAINPWQVYLDE